MTLSRNVPLGGNVYHLMFVVLVLVQVTVGFTNPVVKRHTVVPLHLTPVRRNSHLHALVDPTQQQQEQEDATDVNEEGTTTTMTTRQIIKVEKFARLPVWPVWNGVLIFFISRLFGMEAGAQLEDAIGGRVCPNFFNQQQEPQQDDDDDNVVVDTSPFIMLVHHRHSFFKFDPLRYFQKQFILPEGFPAHPHRGFTTVTYFLKGGFIHRDSLGIQQVYGAEPNRHGKYHTQWLSTGAGLLHEEMFDLNEENNNWCSDQELYQLWLNVPAKDKLAPPTSYLLGGDKEEKEVDSATTTTTPRVITKGAETLVLAGSYQGQSSAAPVTPEEACIFHVTCQPGATWSFTLPIVNPDKDPYTCILYIRKGSLRVPHNNNNNNKNDSSNTSPTGSSSTSSSTEVPVHHTAYFQPTHSSSTIQIEADSQTGVDFMLLAGRPLMEPMAAQGSMVMNTNEEINIAYRDYQLGRMGRPWDHKLSTKEWQDHVQQNPCLYRASERHKEQQ